MLKRHQKSNLRLNSQNTKILKRRDRGNLRLATSNFQSERTTTTAKLGGPFGSRLLRFACTGSPTWRIFFEVEPQAATSGHNEKWIQQEKTAKKNNYYQTDLSKALDAVNHEKATQKIEGITDTL